MRCLSCANNMSSDFSITLSPHAQQRLNDITNYLLEQSGSSEKVCRFIDDLHHYLDLVLGQFPESGNPMPHFGEGLRRVVYQTYSIVYRIKDQIIEILTIYRENQPW